MIKVVGVRFKKAGKIYYFDPADMDIQKDTYVVVGTTKLFDDMTKAFKCFDEVEEKLEELSIMLEEIADFVNKSGEKNYKEEVANV